jgi:hypothetical protein
MDTYFSGGRIEKLIFYETFFQKVLRMKYSFTIFALALKERRRQNIIRQKSLVLKVL